LLFIIACANEFDNYLQEFFVKPNTVRQPRAEHIGCNRLIAALNLCVVSRSDMLADDSYNPLAIFSSQHPHLSIYRDDFLPVPFLWSEMLAG